MPQFEMFWIIVMVASAIVFFKIGDSDFEGKGWLFAGGSILVSLGAHFFLNWWMLGIALSQVGLFGLTTAYNMFAGKRSRM